MINVNDNIKTKLLAGLEFWIEDLEISIEPLKLIDIAKVGYLKYQEMLSNLTFDPEDVIDNKEILHDINSFTIIASNIIYRKEDDKKKYIKLILDAFKLFLKQEVSIFNDGANFGFIFNNDKFINSDVFEEIIKILKWQNCVKKQIDEFSNCANNKAEEIKNKILRGRQSITSRKDIIEFSDLVSIVASHEGNGLNILNIWDLTMFQFNDQFTRMKMWDEYDIDVRSLLAGASSKDVNLKHYIRPIDN